MGRDIEDSQTDRRDIVLFSGLSFKQPLEFTEPLPSFDLSHLVGLEAPVPWELTSQRLYYAALVYRMRAEAGMTTPEEKEWRAGVLHALRNIEWRPFVTRRSTHDYNNWSNGYFPGTWGLLGGDAETFHRNGTDYIERFPVLQHWLRRATNHGIVVLAAYLVGAKAIGQPPVGRELLRSIVEASCRDGCYPEGINYLSFILRDLAPYLAAGWNGQDWREHAARELPGLSGAKRHLRLAMDLDNRITDTFGDARDGIAIKRHVVCIADSLSDEGDMAPLWEHARDGFPHLGPIVESLPRGGNGPAETDYHFPNDVATVRGDSWWLWIFGSRLHLTHNCDHDCGSFLFQNSRVKVGERPGREAFRHNVPLLMDAPGYPDCAGPEPFVRRQRHGRLERIDDMAWRVTAPRSFDGCPTLMMKHVRELHVIDGCLVVLDRVKTQGPGEPIIQFMTTGLVSLYGREVIDERSHCRMVPARRGWVSASVVGTGNPGDQHEDLKPWGDNRGIVFRGRKFAFPEFRQQSTASAPGRHRGKGRLRENRAARQGEDGAG